MAAPKPTHDEVSASIPPSSSSSSSSSSSTEGSVPSNETKTSEEAHSNANSEQETLPIKPDLYMVLVSGTREDVLGLKGTNLWEFKSPKNGNSVLHIAATKSSQANLISDILPFTKDIIKWKNSKGDLAVHSAAKAGNLDCLKALTNWGSYDHSGEDQGINPALLGWGNKEGDTPLHIALENNDLEMAEYLVDQYGEACYKLNDKMVCAIYLAIKAEYKDLAKRMIALTMERKTDSGDALLHGKSIIFAAIEAGNLEILKMIIEKHENLIESHDKQGRTPLSYAAFKGYLQGVHYLVNRFPESAYKCDEDEDESFPIHKAARGGHIMVINMLYGTKELLNRKGQSILHVAAENGKSLVVSYLLKHQEHEKLINLKDEDGNTPLHLATFGFHPKVIYILTRERKVKPELKNKDGLTALDVAEIHSESNPTYEVRLIWMALRYIDAPRSPQSTRESYVDRQQRTEVHKRQNTAHKKKNKKQPESVNKEMIDTQLLVATLVATVTFAAGFTLPGGYKQDDPQIGMALLSHKLAFQVFVMCNTAAMYSSIAAALTLIWGHMLTITPIAIKFAFRMLGVSLAMMSLAFMMGVYVVLRKQPWLSYLVMGMGSFFFALVLGFFVSINSSHIRNPVVRNFFSWTVPFLLLVCEKSRID